MEEKERIEIKNFGPIEHFECDLDYKLDIFVGEQATGKSTICKLIYFVRKIKEYLTAFILEIDNINKADTRGYYSVFIKSLTAKFYDCFGQVNNSGDFDIKYTFNGHFIAITNINRQQNAKNEFGKRKKIYFLFDSSLRTFFNETLEHYYYIIKGSLKEKDVWDFYSVKGYLDNIKMKVRESVNGFFGNDFDSIYIPAGRSIISTLSEQLHKIQFNQLDLVMNEFIEIIHNTKDSFGMNMTEMVQNYILRNNANIKNVQIKDALDLSFEILKGQYVNEKDGEKMYYDAEHWVRLLMASSGQQEALWIVLLLFRMILENKKYFVVIEEPEAHLFPNGQFAVAKLIGLFMSSTNSSVIITTHSPYILSSFNALIYSSINNKLEKRYQISREEYFAYASNKNGNGSQFVSIKDAETGLISFEYIDSISIKIGEIFD